MTLFWKYRFMNKDIFLQIFNWPGSNYIKIRRSETPSTLTESIRCFPVCANTSQPFICDLNFVPLIEQRGFRAWWCRNRYRSVIMWLKVLLTCLKILLDILKFSLGNDVAPSISFGTLELHHIHPTIRFCIMYDNDIKTSISKQLKMMSKILIRRYDNKNWFGGRKYLQWRIKPNILGTSLESPEKFWSQACDPHPLFSLKPKQAQLLPYRALQWLLKELNYD